jgi:hypothetical protein
MRTSIRCGAVVVLLVFSVACGSSGPTSPSGTQPASSPSQTGTQLPSFPSPTPPRLLNFPPLTGPSRTFIFDGVTASELSYRVSDYTWQSHVVLYDNGACVLQYPPSIYGEGRFPGAYREANGVIMFLFQSSTGRSIDEPWNDATGTLTPRPPAPLGKGDLLTIRYPESMHHADFEDAVYVLMP